MIARPAPDRRTARRPRAALVGLAVLAACLPARGATGGGDVLPAGTTAVLLPPSPAPALAAFVGGYAAAADTLLVLEDDGRLFLLGADSARRPLRLVGEPAARLAVGGAPAETLAVERDARGRPSRLLTRARAYARLAFAPEEGASFRIVPQRPVEELRRAALAATPPAQPDTLLAPDLVEPTTLDPTIRLDVRYATTDNFMGARFYDAPRAFLQRPAAEALVRAHRRLRPLGYGLLVHDAYRPWYVTWMFWEATPEHQREFVADPAGGSRHNRGAAVDVSLYELATGRPADMPSGYDEFTPRAHARYAGGTARQRALRDLLRRAMEAEGFAVYAPEWWHFDHAGWRRYPVMNRRFDAP